MKKSGNRNAVKNPWQRAALVLFGVLVAFAILEVGLQASGFFIRVAQEHKNQAAVQRGASYRILCIGESTTQGQYPRLLEKVLNARQSQIRFSVIDKGLISTDTNVIAENLEGHIKKYSPDMIVAMIGINDAGPKHMPVGFASSERGFAKYFKTYKLMRWLFMHIQTGLEEMKKRLATASRSEVAVVALRDDVYYVKQGMRLEAQGKKQEAKVAFHEAVRLNPENAEAIFRELFLHEPDEQGMLFQCMVERFEKIFTACPEENPYAGYLLGMLNTIHKNAEAESLLKVLRSHCRAGWISFFSAETAAGQGRYEEAEAYYKEAISLNKKAGRQDHRPYWGLAYVYRLMGRSELSEEYFVQGNALAPQGYSRMTVDNYRKIRKLSEGHGIHLVCVQYPLRSIEPLKRIFHADHDQNVSFVDNEKLFKDALKKHRFGELFRDKFAGDFGHCTDLGNELLAENIAGVILRDLPKISMTESVLDH